MEKMTEGQIDAALKMFPEWSATGDTIQRTYAFKDFVEAMGFVNSVAKAAEDAQHHPDILIRWNKVTLTVSTHDAGGITQKDFDLASKCDSFVATADEAPKGDGGTAGEGGPKGGEGEGGMLSMTGSAEGTGVVGGGAGSGGAGGVKSKKKG